MDFENARWVKLYCHDTGTWLRLGWQGRTVALHLLRSVNASGVLSDLGDEPELILSELLRLPVVVPVFVAMDWPALSNNCSITFLPAASS